MSEYTAEELMIILIAREIRDGERVAVGTMSPIPAAGCLLASASHAPSAEVFIRGSQQWWPFRYGRKDFFDMAQRGEFDLFFLGGAQIDRQGNINLCVIGPHDRPRVRLPGGAGSSLLYYTAKRVILFRTAHDRRTFVERVDFVTAPGFPPPGTHIIREATTIITPLATMQLNGESKTMEIVSLHPGVTLEEVQSNTSFPLPHPEPIPVTTPPEPDELSILRTLVKTEMKSIYPKFAARLR